MAEEDEDIDAETLQAQIDLSLSVANSLVSSWMKPSKKPKTPLNENLEMELKEHMRRPPRLGVGASIPESISGSSRETARLKGHLAGKGIKRPRETSSSNKQLSDEDEESRAGAIRKKPTPNPFAMPAPKKKKVVQADIDNTVSPLPTGQADDLSNDATQPKTADVDNGKKPDNHKSLGLDPSHVDAESTGLSSEKLQNTSFAGSHQQFHRRVPESSSAESISEIGHSVLNLNGPVGEHNSESESAAGSPSKPKKKRKRRKKKKKSLDIGAAEASKDT